VDEPEIDGTPAAYWDRAGVRELRAMPNVRFRLHTQVSGVFDHGYVLACEQLGGTGPRQRLWRIRTERIVSAIGAIERPLAFPGNDVPGVMLASAMRDYLVNWGVSVGDRPWWSSPTTTTPTAPRCALHRRGPPRPRIVDAPPAPDGELVRAARDAGIRIEAGRGIGQGQGQAAYGRLPLRAGRRRRPPRGHRLRRRRHVRRLDPLGPSLVPRGRRAAWDDARAMFLPDPQARRATTTARPW
jgi:sarcosine oxidase subunit alpha